MNTNPVISLLVRQGHISAAVLVALSTGPLTSAQIWDKVYCGAGSPLTPKTLGNVLNGMVFGGLIDRPTASLYYANFAPIPD